MPTPERSLTRPYTEHRYRIFDAPLQSGTNLNGNDRDIQPCALRACFKIPWGPVFG